MWPAPVYLIPVLAIFTAAIATVQLTGLDQRLADLIFGLEGGAWSLRNNPLLEAGLHRGARAAVVLLAMAVLVALGLSARMTRLRRFRAPLLYLLSSMAAGAASVSLIKSISPQHCPWSLVRYGGRVASEGFLDGLWSPGHCFPAGHASAGYCLFGLYFVASRYAPQWRSRALAVPLLLGLTFGITQQLRGAHFLSHDLWSAMLCWVSAWWVARLMLVERTGGVVPLPGAESPFATVPAESARPAQAWTSSRYESSKNTNETSPPGGKA